jgi:hypothetical protein
MKKILLSLFLSSVCTGLFSQLDYTLTYAGSTYTGLSGATDISNKAWTSEHVMKMPFAFKYFDSSYDTIHIMMNTSVSGIFFSNGGVDLIFFGSEGYMPEDGDASLSPISYAISGVSPNRILKLQFKNIHAVLADTSERYIVNNQVWLYETSNKIEYHFGPNEITDLNITEYFIGMIDADNSPYLAISGTAAQPTLVRVTNVSTFKGINSHPLDGQVYTLSPKSNVSVNQLVRPYQFNQVENGFNFYSKDLTRIGIYDISGKLVQTVQQSPEQLLNQDLGELPAGIYLVNLLVGERQFIEKIIVR